MAAGPPLLALETGTIDSAVDFGLAQHIGDQFIQPIMFCEVDWFEANLLCVGEPLLIHVADQYDSRTRIRADPAAARPTGPAPAIYTAEPTPNLAFTAP